MVLHKESLKIYHLLIGANKLSKLAIKRNCYQTECFHKLVDVAYTAFAKYIDVQDRFSQTCSCM